MNTKCSSHAYRDVRPGISRARMLLCQGRDWHGDRRSRLARTHTLQSSIQSHTKHVFFIFSSLILRNFLPSLWYLGFVKVLNNNSPSNICVLFLFVPLGDLRKVLLMILQKQNKQRGRGRLVYVPKGYKYKGEVLEFPLKRHDKHVNLHRASLSQTVFSRTS